MDEQKKPFDTTSIVLLLLVAGTSDIADLATDLLFPVPVIGQIVFLGNSLILSPVIWAIIQFSFIMKTGAGRASLVAVAGGLGNLANIPGSETVTTIIGILIANNPKLSEVASLVSKAEGKGGAVAGKTTAGKKANDAFEAGKAPGATFKELGYGSEYFKENEEWLKKYASEYYEKEMATAEGRKRETDETKKPEDTVSPEALGEKPEAMEELQKKLLKETPKEENVRIDDRNNEVDLRRK